MTWIVRERFAGAVDAVFPGAFGVAGMHSVVPTASVRWEDLDDVRLWIAALRAAVDDALGAGEDAARPKRDRVLSRAEARRKIEAAELTIEALLNAGERSLA